jgi:hypothetical protein
MKMKSSKGTFLHISHLMCSIYIIFAIFGISIRPHFERRTGPINLTARPWSRRSPPRPCGVLTGSRCPSPPRPCSPRLGNRHWSPYRTARWLVLFRFRKTQRPLAPFYPSLHVSRGVLVLFLHHTCTVNG